MDEQTKATARALLDLHPRGYAGELGIQVTKSPGTVPAALLRDPRRGRRSLARDR